MDYISANVLTKPISRLIMGTASLQPAAADAMLPVLDEFVSLGGTTIDTAENYGQSELVLGEWMKDRGNREQLVILTKGAHPYGRNRVTPEDISSDLTGSLRRLQVDYVEIYMLHRDDISVPVEPIIDVLNKHINSGVVKQIGVSNWSWQRIQEANEYAASSGQHGFEFSSTNLSLAKPLEPMWPGSISADEDTCRWHEHTQIPLLSWAAQAGGFFTGRFTSGDRSDSDMVRTYYCEDNWERFRRAEKLAKQYGITTPQIVMAYVLAHKFPTCGIVGSRSVEELRANYDALQFKLTPGQIEWLNLDQATE